MYRRLLNGWIVGRRHLTQEEVNLWRFKGDCQRYFSVSLQRTQACRATGNPYESICRVNGEGVTLSLFCYAFLPDDENDVWLRELSCPGSTICADPDYRKSFLLNGSFSSDVSYRLCIWRFYIVSKRLETCSASGLQLQNKFYMFLSRYVSDGKAPLSFSIYSKARYTQKLLSMPKICFDNAYVPHIS